MTRRVRRIDRPTRFRFGRWRGCVHGGFTLIEAMIVVAIIGIMAALAAGSMSPDLPRYRTMQAARLLQSNILDLRMASITTGRQSRLVLRSADPSPDDYLSYGGSWEMQVGDLSSSSTVWEYMPPDDGADDDQSGGFVNIGQGGNHKAKGVGLMEWDALLGPAAGNANSIVFNPRGWLSNPPSDFDNQGYITLTLRNKEIMAKNVTDEVYVRIARSGYVRLETALGRPRADFGVGTAGSSTDAP